MDFCLVAKGSVVGKAQAKDLVRLVKLVKVVIVGLLIVGLLTIPGKSLRS